jgi:hypothetical protein
MKYYTFCVLLLIVGCASDQGLSKKDEPMKSPQTLSSAQQSIAFTNGFALGKWSTSCLNTDAETQEIVLNNDLIVVRSILDNKIYRVSNIYEVSSISRDLISIKSSSKDNHGYFVGFEKVGYLNGKRMTLDEKVLYFNIENKKELIKIKNGYQVTKAEDGNQKSKKASLIYQKCD